MSETKVLRERVARTSGPSVEDRKQQLGRLFPEVMAEGKVDFEKLRALLGGQVEARQERFSFTWAGKQDAVDLVQTPTWATMVPCPEESVNFETTANAFIEGDNLEVLKLLFKPYFGRVKLIYIDPPYNTGQDFVYPDNYANPLDTYLQLTGQADAAGNLLTSNPDTSGRYHSRWLSMMYPRLFLARQLLREDGVIFVSIDDHEVHNLRLLMNEVFGEENFLATVIWQHSIQAKGYTGKFSVHHNYLLGFQLSEQFQLDVLERTEEHNKNYSNSDNDPKGAWRTGDVRNALYRPNLIFDILTPSGKTITPPKNGWRWSKQTIAKKIASGEIIFSEDETRIIRKIYLANVEGRVPETIWFGKEAGTTRDGSSELKELFGGDQPFDTPKPVQLVKRLLQLSTTYNEEDIVLDFFAGSCTTAQAVLEQNREDGGNRRFLMVQLPELAGNKDYATIADIGKERIRRVIAKLQREDAGTEGLRPPLAEEMDLGFKVFKLTRPAIQPFDVGDERDPELYAAKLAPYNDPLVPGWKPEHVLWEVALREGFGLQTRFEPKKLANGNTLYEVTDPETGQRMAVCLDDAIKMDLSRCYELTPERVLVCRDVALDDSAAANLALQCRLKTI